MFLNNIPKIDPFVPMEVPRGFLKDVCLSSDHPFKTKDSDLILTDNIKGTILVCDKQSSYESLCFYIDMLRAKYQVS